METVVVNNIRMGIDPGKDGFISICVNGSEFDFIPIPLIGKNFDIHSFVEIMKSIRSSTKDIHCVIEDVHAIFGSSAKATFSFGYICGAIIAGVISSNIPLTLVKPKEWQKEMWQGVPIQKKSSSTGKTVVTDTKATSLIAAKRLFPNVDLRATNRCKNPHDGKVDALLMSEYCKRKF